MKLTDYAPTGRQLQDRLICFGFHYLTTLLASQGQAIEVVNQAENGTEDLLADLTAIVYSFVNGAYNIIRKVAPDAFAQGRRGCVVHPMRQAA
ncbi:MAG TPA: hypothetical protein VKQ36_11960 [Ktedonobacterales bacterium]|nr:hypothetical protein [Ktedonobacterales bacterium]